MGTQLAVLLFELKYHFDQTCNPSPFLPWWFIKMSRPDKPQKVYITVSAPKRLCWRAKVIHIIPRKESNKHKKKTLLLRSHSVWWVVNEKKVFELRLFPKLLFVGKRRMRIPCFFINLCWPQHVINVVGSAPVVLGEGGLLNFWQGLVGGYMDQLS